MGVSALYLDTDEVEVPYGLIRDFLRDLDRHEAVSPTKIVELIRFFGRMQQKKEAKMYVRSEESDLFQKQLHQVTLNPLHQPYHTVVV
jgi:hypothetical protein